MITSTTFLEQTVGWYREDYFEDYAQVIAGWVVRYFDEYREAPGATIQNIYTVEKDNLPPALAVNVATYLTNLSTAHQGAQPNERYLLDTAQQYFKRKGYERMFTTGRELLKAGRVDEAIALHDDFRSVVRATSNWENPFDPKVIRDHFREPDTSYQVLEYRGALGRMIGPLERNWLVAFMGPMKRGKSFWCEESIFAGLAGRKKVAYINLEMPNRTVRSREYKRITALPDKMGRYIIPQFDCQLNQYGVCNLSTRTGAGALIAADAITAPEYVVGHPWQVCTWCRDNAGALLSAGEVNTFAAGVWYSHTNKMDLRVADALREADSLQMLCGDSLRQITYPAYSATVDDVRRDIDELIYAHKFYPDIVVLDYADILGSEQSYNQERHRLDNIWKRLKQAAGEMDALWITATQTNRKGLEKMSGSAAKMKNVSQVDTAEDIRKMAHVDAMFAINRGDHELHYTRMSHLANRHRDVSPQQVVVLHQLELGLPYMDSDVYPARYKKPGT
jgi:hypothetical protein